MSDFKNPDKIYAPAPFWSWNEKLCKKELERQIDEMNDKGWGGYFMHSRVGLVTEYLSEEWMELTKVCADKARETKTSAWLYDEDKWPSGFAGGIVPQNKKFRSKALLMLNKDELTDNDEIIKEVQKNTTVYYICQRTSPLGDEWFNGMCYVDLMNPEAVDYYLEVTHEKYKKHCGKYFGEEIPGVFTDEPCYLMAGHYKEEYILPWSDYLPDFFKKLKGYDIENNVEKLFIEIDDFHKIRYDFFEAATKLFLESFTKRYHKWCKENNLKLTGHFMAEDTLQSQSYWIGAAMPHYEYMDWPGIDKLGRHIEQTVTTKQVSSVADQLGKERCFSEIYGCVGQHVSFYHRKWIGDWQAALGINFFNYHLSLYSMRGERKRDFPANLFYQQPWWDEERSFSEYMTRLSYTLSQGERDVDILMIHPIGSTWADFKQKKENNFHGKSKYDEGFKKLTDKLIEEKLDFHYGDEFIMEEQGAISGSNIVIGKCIYNTIIIPSSLTIRKSTLKLINEFMNQKMGTLIIQTPAPTLVNGEEYNIVWPENTIFADNVDEVSSYLSKKYNKRISIVDKKTNENIKKIIIHERIQTEGRVVFLANTDEENSYEVKITINTEKDIFIKDLGTGETYNIKQKQVGENKVLELIFERAGSLLLFIPQEILLANNAPNYLDSGIILEKRIETLLDIKDWKTQVLEENVLPINKATLYINEVMVLENDYIAKAWHDYFYSSENGTDFKAEYTFNVNEIPKGNITTAIEMAENLDTIEINGKSVHSKRKRGENISFDPSKCWKDISFTKVDITGQLVIGKNKITIAGKKINNITGPNCHIGVTDHKNHMPTEVEAIYIIGEFSVENLDNKIFSISGKKIINSTNDLKNHGYPFYAGKIKYSAVFNISSINNENIFLELNEVNAACVRVTINGKDAGIKYYKPYLIEIGNLLVNGENTIQIELSTTLFNLLGPNYIEGILENQFVGPQTFIDKDKMTDIYALLPYGIGGARLLK